MDYQLSHATLCKLASMSYQLSHATIYVIRFLGLAVHVTSMNTHRIGWATRQRASFKNAKLL